MLSLVLAPLATELPEKANSFFWVQDGKDALALGNITGAMAFQATLPIAFGLAADRPGTSTASRVVSGSSGWSAAVVAYWSLHLRGRFELPPILVWMGLFLAFIAYVAVA